MASDLAQVANERVCISPRLLVLASTYPRWAGDPEPGFVHELAKRLVPDFDVMVIAPHAAGALVDDCMEGVRVRRYRYAPASLETLVNSGGIITNLKLKPWKWLLVPGFLLGLCWQTWRQVRKFKPEVIHAHWLMPQGLIVALLSLVANMPPMLVTSHGADLYALKAWPMRALKRFVMARAAAMTVVSHAMRDELVRLGVDDARASVQPMGVDMRRRFVPLVGVERSRAEILFVGRLVEKKGLRHLIEAMPAILKEHPSAVLTIVGFGPEEQERREQVLQSGLQDSVRFLGAVPQAELPEFYRRAAVFVAPFVEARSGDQEGLGLVMVEAIGCGCPVVASRLPAVSEVFGLGEGFTVPPARPDLLAKSICHVLSSPRVSADVNEIRNALLERFDWERVAGRYAARLRDMVLDARVSRT